MFNTTDKKASGFTTGATYFTKSNMIAGEAGTEWIMSAPMLKNPVMANLAGALQTLQVSGQYKNVSLGSGQAPGSSPGQGGSGQASDPMLALIYAQLQKNQAALDAYAKKPVSLDFLAFQQKQQEVEQNFQANML